MRAKTDRKTSFTKFLWENLKDDIDIEYRRKIILLFFVCMIGIVILVPMGILAFKENNFYLGMFDFIMAGVLTFNIVYLRITGYYKVFIYASVVTAMFFYMYLFIFGGVHNTAFVWYYTFPLFSLFLLGLFHGSLLTFILFASALIFFWINPNKPYLASYPLDLKLRFIPSFVAVYIFAYTFEYLRDRTQKKLEASLKNLEKEKATAEKASRAKSDFLANMSHELRTPLNHIIGFTELIVEKNFGDLNETQEEYLRDVLSSSYLLLSLINDILDLSKIESGKLELNPKNLALKVVLKKSITMIKEKCLKHGIEISIDVAEAPETVQADERKLKQILYNLLSNAVKFTPDGGKISLRAKLMEGLDFLPGNLLPKIPVSSNKSGKFVWITVSDTGIGIKKDDLERIFKPFEQVDHSLSRKYQGTGLGLSLTKNMVELHGGMIWVDSEGEGKGSTFSFFIPVSQV